MINDYSGRWFAEFLDQVDAGETRAQVDFVCRQLPQPEFLSILDLGCGSGRHASLLADQGYQVLGVDRSLVALEAARSRSGHRVSYVQEDMRALPSIPGEFDGVISRWQSFGYFGAEDNLEVLRGITQKLRTGGSLIIDVYHRSFFEANQGVRQIDRAGTAITETSYVTCNRLTVTLHYGDSGASDRFDWQLYTPEDLTREAARCGLQCIGTYADFDEGTPASPSKHRMELVLTKV